MQNIMPRSLGSSWTCNAKHAEKWGKWPTNRKNFLSTVTLTCNLFFFSVYHQYLIFTNCFCKWVLMRTHFFTAVFLAINHCLQEIVVIVVETGNGFSMISIFNTLFANDVYLKVSIMFLISFFTVKKRNKIPRNHIFNFFPVFKKRN